MESDYKCIDCKVDTMRIGEYYSVHSHIWIKTGLSSMGGMLCIGCLENRLGYTLTSKDFTKYPINRSNDFYRSQRLISRLNNHVTN